MSTDDDQQPEIGTSTDDPFAVLHRRRRGVWVTTAAAVALGMAVWGSNVAGAATSPTTSPARPSPAGTSTASTTTADLSSRSAATDGGGGAAA